LTCRLLAEGTSRSSIMASKKRSIKMNRYIYLRVCLWVQRPLDELTGNFMLSRKGQCKWTCRVTPFRIAFILLHLVLSVNKCFHLCELKLLFRVLHKCLISEFTHTKEGNSIPPNNVDAFWRHLLLTSPCLSNKNIVRSWLLLLYKFLDLCTI